MDDMAAVEVGQATEDLACYVRQVLFIGDAFPFQGATVHELEKYLDFAAMIVHVMALDNVLVIHVSEDLNFSMDLTAHGFLVGTVYNLKRVKTTSESVTDLIHGASAAATNPIEALELNEWHLLLRLT